MTELRGTLVLRHGLFRGVIEYGTSIEAVEVEAEGGGALPFILPGFVDTHVHGGGGFDTMDGADGVAGMALFHLRHGVTTLLPTTITNPWREVMGALAGVAEVKAGGSRHVMPDLPGVHLEGPFISPHRLGAQPPFALAPTPDLVDEVLETGVVRLVTLAPELEHSSTAAARFAAAGVRVSFGHTVATAEQVALVAEVVRGSGGTVGFTHLFNAMSQLGSREPGAVGAALADAEAYAELILDLHHVHPTSFRAALAAKPEHLHLITDAVRACGMAEGVSELGGQRVMVKDGAVRLESGNLAGSVLTLDQALRNAVEFGGVDLPTASRALSGVPARYLGLADRGELAVGRRADLVVLGADLRVQDVYVAGRRLR
ncbi:MAG: N-acetylglucosamine-6-phosphate deacetylase [Trueperaceae bacterium]|nr:N-acetylglucosamine-6-phosphate deacetylase [Trueperaceae bacterium]